MIIDLHTHTFPDEVAERAVRGLRRKSGMKPFADGTAEGLRTYAEEAGIGMSVILPVATRPEQVEDINNKALARNEAEEAAAAEGSAGRDSAGDAGTVPGGRRARLLSFGCIHPGYEDYRGELARIARAGLPGIKIHPFFQGLALDDPAWLSILDAAFENGLIVSVHGGDDLGFPGLHMATAPMFRKIMKELGDVPLIAAHMGGMGEWKAVPEYLAGTGIYFDISCTAQCVHSDTEGGDMPPVEQYFLPADEFEELLRAFPSDHIFFGTDSPWSDAKEAIDILMGTGLSDDTKLDILGRSAESLLKAHGVRFP